MTAQVHDKFRFRKKEFSLAGISEGRLFDISILDLEPSMASTACWRGYQAVFGIVESHLVLDALHVNLLRAGGGENQYERETGPAINGIAPSPSRRKSDAFNNHYDGLNYHLEYSGGLLLADGFIREMYIHMGFHPAWKYKTVLELVFDAGVLKEEFDRSEQMAEIREMVRETRQEDSSGDMPSEDEIAQFVERAFDRRYRR